MHEAGIHSRILTQSNCKAKIRLNRRMYRERNRIERMIVHLKINRAIATRYDRSHRRSDPTCNLAHGHTLFQEFHGARRRRLSIDTADPWGQKVLAGDEPVVRFRFCYLTR